MDCTSAAGVDEESIREPQLPQRVWSCTGELSIHDRSLAPVQTGSWFGEIAGLAGIFEAIKGVESL